MSYFGTLETAPGYHSFQREGPSLGAGVSYLGAALALTVLPVHDMDVAQFSPTGIPQQYGAGSQETLQL